MAHVADIEQLLAASLAADNGVREAAENRLTELLHNNPDTLATAFVYAMRHSSMIENRQTAAVLFRRYAWHITDTKASFWPRCQPATREAIKAQLLEAISDETPVEVRHKVCDAVAQVAKNLALEQPDPPPGQPRVHFWPEVLGCMWTCMQSPSPIHRESALRIFSAVPGLFGSELARYMNEVAQVLNQGLQDVANLEVQLAAARAFTTFVVTIPKEQRAHFAVLVPVVLQVVLTCLEKNKIEGAQACLETLIDLADMESKFFRSVLVPVSENMVKIASNVALDDGCRHMALELITVLCESAPGMMRKFPALHGAIVPLCLQMMMEVEDDDEWSKSDKVDEDVESSSAVGEQALDRIACALGPDAVLMIALQGISQMLARPEWQARYAALMAISCIGEGCYKKMKDQLKMIVDAVIPRLLDPHPRVRYGACNAIGQMSTDFAPRENRQTAVCFQSLFHAQVVPGLCRVTQDVENPRVQAHAAAALINFCEGAARNVLAPHLEMILSHLAQLLTSKHMNVQEQAVTTIATVADSAREHFAKFYPVFMPPLKHILISAREKHMRLLRGKTMECISLIGLAVGKDMFASDAGEVMMALQDVQQSTETDDPQISYMIASWGRICQILGKDFAPYLGVVMPPLLRSAQLQPDLVPLEEDEVIDDDQADWQFVAIEDQRIGIKTSTLEEKRAACEMLCIYARQLGPMFAPYVAEILPISLKLLKFYFEDGVRYYSAALMPFLIGALKDDPTRGPAVALQTWLQTIANPMMEAIKDEYDSEALVIEIDALRDCIERVGSDGLPPDLLSVLTGVLNSCLSDYKERHVLRLEARTQDEDYDVEGESALKEEEGHDNDVLRELCDVIHALFDVKNVDFLPYFDNLVNFYVEMLAPNRSAIDNQWALCVFDDLIEACGPRSTSYAHLFAERMVQCLQHAEAAVRQSASYGIGVMASHGGDAYLPVLAQALPVLVQVIQDPHARDMGNIDATENCISAVVKIVQNPSVGLAAASPAMIASWLPITEDVDEADHIYTFFAVLITRNEPSVMDPATLTRVLNGFGLAVSTDLFEGNDSPVNHMREAVKHLRSVLPASDLPVLFSSLTTEAQQGLTKLLA